MGGAGTHRAADARLRRQSTSGNAPCIFPDVAIVPIPDSSRRKRRRVRWLSGFGVVAVLLVLIAFAMRERRHDDRAERLAERRNLSAERWRVETRGALPASAGSPRPDSEGDAQSTQSYSVARLATAAAALLPQATADAGAAPRQLAADGGARAAEAETRGALGADAGATAADAAPQTAGDAAASGSGDAGATALAASIPCGPATCSGGQVCCNESCGICARPGEQCSQQECGVHTLPISALCGINTCNVGFVCCNPSCGTCVRPGASCDPEPCAGAIDYPVSVTCGMSTCNAGMECCNASCGTCVPRGGTCSKETCS